MRTNTALRVLPAALLSLAVFANAGCGTVLESSASMRIDVEVYNGPLAKTEEAQLAELKSSLKHAKRALDVVKDGLLISECRLGCRGETDGDCKGNNRGIWFNAFPVQTRTLAPKDEQPSSLLERLFFPKYTTSETEGKIETNKQDSLIQVCPMIVELKDDAQSLSGQFDGCPNDPEMELLKCASRLGHQLRSTAEFWATKHIGIVSSSRRARIGLVELTNTAAELGNEVAARADALLKQRSLGNGPEGITRELLPTSTYLQDSGATDYLNLITWFDAAVDRPDSTKLDRVRMIERLITDTHWSKINTVFAAGQGDVRMVFIKDDIGNWNLKSFSNDPTELLNAYKKIGLAALSTAAGLAGQPGSRAELGNVMQFANDVALGSGGGAEGLQSIQSLHTNTAQRLDDLMARQERRASALNARIDELNELVPALEQAHRAAEAGFRALVGERNGLAQNRDDKKADRETLRSETAKIQMQLDAGDITDNDRQQIMQKIALTEAKAKQLEAELASLDQSIEAKDAAITEDERELRRSSHTLIEKQDELAAALAEQKRLGADTRAQASAILSVHEGLIDQLQSSVVKLSEPE